MSLVFRRRSDIHAVLVQLLQICLFHRGQARYIHAKICWNRQRCSVSLQVGRRCQICTGSDVAASRLALLHRRQSRRPAILRGCFRSSASSGVLLQNQRPRRTLLTAASRLAFSIVVNRLMSTPYSGVNFIRVFCSSRSPCWHQHRNPIKTADCNAGDAGLCRAAHINAVLLRVSGNVGFAVPCERPIGP